MGITVEDSHAALKFKSTVPDREQVCSRGEKPGFGSAKLEEINDMFHAQLRFCHYLTAALAPARPEKSCTIPMRVITVPQASIMAPIQIEGLSILRTILLGISRRAYGKKKTVRLVRVVSVNGESRNSW